MFCNGLENVALLMEMQLKLCQIAVSSQGSKNG